MRKTKKKGMKRFACVIVCAVLSASLLQSVSLDAYAYTVTAAGTNDYTTWKQTSSSWGEARPWPNASIPKFGDAGCWITSVAILLRHYNVVTDSNVNTFNPLICNNRLMSYGIVNSAGDWCNLDKMSSAYPGFSYAGTASYSFSQLKSLYDQGYACIVHETRGHYVAVRSVSSSNVVVMDPGYSTTSLTASDSIQYYKVTANPNPTPTISGANTPGTLTVGATYSISGTINCGKALTKVTVGCYDANGTMKTGKTVYPNSTSYNIKNVDASVYFNNLNPGVYRYCVQASTSSGTTTLVDKVFIVLAKSAMIQNGTYIFKISGNTSYVIGVKDNSANSGANVQLEKSQNISSQAFLVHHEGNGYYSLRNVGSGMYLDVNGAYSTSGTNVQQWSQNTSAAQRWQILPSGNDYCLVPQCGNTLCLDVNGGNFVAGTNIQVYTANLTAAQKFKIAQTDCNYPAGNKITFDAQGGTLPGAFATYAVSGVNTDRAAKALTVYNVSGASPYTNQFGREAAVDKNGKVTAIRQYGSAVQLSVPAGGMVVSGHLDGSSCGAKFTDQLSIGTYVSCDYAAKKVSAYKTYGAYLSENKYVKSGSVYGELPTPEKDGYTFDGWYTASSGGGKITSGSVYSAAKLYAHWRKVTSVQSEPSRKPGVVTDQNMQISDENTIFVPKVNTKLTDKATKAVYKVTKQGSAVTYMGTGDMETKAITIPATVTISGITYKVISVSKGALKNNKKVKSVIIGENVTGIGKSAFQNCTSLEKVTISKNVKKIGSRAFYNCKKMKSLTVKSKKLISQNIGAKAFSKAGSSNYKRLTVKVPGSKFKAYRKRFRQKGLSSKVKIKK